MRALFTFALLVVCAVAAMGCRGQVSKDAPIVPIRNMHDQPRYNPQQASPFFADGRTMRPLPEGVVAQEMEADVAVASGRTGAGDAWLAAVPGAVVARAGGMPAFVERGAERYGIYCAPCHGLAGDGLGMVSSRAVALGAAAMKAPTFHDDRLRRAPDGQLFATITNGVRNMPAYRHAVPVDDRWAIVAYVRALQVANPATKTAANGAAARPATEAVQ